MALAILLTESCRSGGGELSSVFQLCCPGLASTMDTAEDLALLLH
jgi:hypothetical protein